jgi:hypothetical protein
MTPGHTDPVRVITTMVRLRARYLLIVLDGLAVARALPDTTLAPHDEEVGLPAAASTVLHLPWPQGDTARTRLG